VSVKSIILLYESKVICVVVQRAKYGWKVTFDDDFIGMAANRLD